MAGFGGYVLIVFTLILSIVDRQEERLKNDSRDLNMVKMKSMFAISFVFMALLSVFNSM